MNELALCAKNVAFTFFAHSREQRDAVRCKDAEIGCCVKNLVSVSRLHDAFGVGATFAKKLIDDATHWSVALKCPPDTESMVAVEVALGHVQAVASPSLLASGIAPSFIPHMQYASIINRLE